jgi:hypothetical protein
MTRRRWSERRFALAAVAIAGLALVATCPRAPRPREAARPDLLELYLELGRQRLLAGDAERALAYLGEAYGEGGDDAGLRFLLARAVAALLAETPGSRAGARYPEGPRTVRLRRNESEGRAPFANADLNDDWTMVVAVDAAGAPAPVAVRFSPDGEQVAGLLAEGRFALWASATGELRITGELPLARALEALETTVLRGAGTAPSRDVAGLALAFSADGTRLATAGSDGSVRIWDTADGVSLARFEAGSVAAVAVDPAGRRLVTAGDRVAMTWNLETGRRIVSLDLPRDATIVSLVHSPDGRRVLTAGRHPEVRLFATASGELDGFLVGSVGTVCCAAFSPDGGLIVTAGDDGAARIWDAERGRLLAVLPLPGGDVIHAEYGPRSAQIATVHADGTLDVQAVGLYDGGTAALDRLRKCFVHWRLASGPLGEDRGARGAGRLVPATPDPAACGGLTRPRPAPRREPEAGARRAAPAKPRPLPLRFETAVSGTEPEVTYAVLREADLVETLRSLARLSQVNVVLAPGVGGTISAEIPGGGLEEILGWILAAYGLASEASGSLRLVLPAERKLPSESAVVSGGRLPVGEPIDVSVKNADLLETLRTFAAAGAASVMIDADVSGLVSAEIDGVPWDRALVAILRLHGLELEVAGKYWRVRRQVRPGEP